MILKIKSAIVGMAFYGSCRDMTIGFALMEKGEKMMSNAELFKKVFGIYAEEFWAYSREKMLGWLTSDVPNLDVGDTISRQAAIEALGERPPLWTGGDYELGCANQYDLDRLAIETVPSAQRDKNKQKKGKWEQKEDPYGFFDTIPVCSVCGHTTKMRETYAYCPNCGAEMEASE